MSAGWLLTWAAQTLALVALTWLAARLPGCRVRAGARSAAWSATLALCAGLAAWPWLQAAGAPDAGPAASGVAAAAGFAPVVVPEPADRLWPWCVRVWAAGAAVALALVARDLVRVMRLKRRVRPLSQADLERLGAHATLVAPSGHARVCWCDGLDTPSVLGFTHPIIAVPRAQATRLSDEQFQHVVLHELAHVRRRDDWCALAEHVIAAVMWVNPVIHLARRQAAVAREMACDEWVVRRAVSPVAYARCLVEVAGLRSRARRHRFAAAVTGQPGLLRRRIMSVLAFDGRPPARAIAVLAWLAPVIVCIAAAGLLQLPPVFVVAQTPTGVPAAALPAAAAGEPVPVSVASTPATAAPIPTSMPRRRQAPSRRSTEPPHAAAQVEIDLSPPAQAPAPPLPAAGPDTGVAHEPPLAARPLPAAGAVGVAAANRAPDAGPAGPAPRDQWWRGPRELGEATGGAAAAAGRATASFFTRVALSMPTLITK
jgi:beta-lactamase regulating signal transducer with metallopeptidase domain